MTHFSQFIITLNALFFLLYGLQCFVSKAMILEFKRFGMTDIQRNATGTLQLLGAGGVVIGLFNPIIGLLASGGLSIMMLVAFMVRIKIKDGFLKSSPSLLFLALNSWISVNFYTHL